jgi:hypothetical protein
MPRMSLARAWTRQLYRASGAALMVPASVIASLAVLALAGGFGRLGALGQALSGPSVPAATNQSVGATLDQVLPAPLVSTSSTSTSLPFGLHVP